MVELLARVGRPWVVIVEARVIVVASKRGNERGSRFAARHRNPIRGLLKKTPSNQLPIHVLKETHLEPRVELDVLDAAFE